MTSVLSIILATHLAVVLYSQLTYSFGTNKGSTWSNHRKDQIKTLEVSQDDSVYNGVALDPTKAHRLAILEEKLVSSLTPLKESKKEKQIKGNQCLLWMSKYLSEYEEDEEVLTPTTGESAAEIVSQNPLLLFKMIRRLYLTLMGDTLKACLKDTRNRKVAETVTNVVKQANFSEFSIEDFEDAREGVLRIQYFYGLDAINELRHGIIKETDTQAYLSFEDCLALANKALEMKAYVLAYEWLVSADLNLSEKKYSRYCNPELLQKEVNKFVKSLTEAVNVTTADEMEELLDNQQQKTMEPYRKYEDYALCRGDSIVTVNTTKEAKKNTLMECRYGHKWHPYFYINPVKTQLLSYDPPVFQLYDFIDKTAIEVIQELGRKHMTRQGTSNKKNRKDTTPQGLDQLRTTLTSPVIDNNNQPAAVKNLMKKIEKMAGVEVSKKFASDWFLETHGALGGYYDRHHDSILKKGAPIDKKGDRLATLLLFLSDVPLGGYTAFSRLGVFAEPVKGSAVMWFNLKPDGKREDRVFYTECPVALGFKDVAKVWVNQYDNMWSYPCENSTLVADV